jgi:hypothetical protein
VIERAYIHITGALRRREDDARRDGPARVRRTDDRALREHDRFAEATGQAVSLGWKLAMMAAWAA